MLPTVATVSILLLLIWYAIPMAVRRRGEARLRRKVRGSLVLTYDDGPGDDLTPVLLDLLARAGQRATFFVIGCKAEARPQRVNALIQAGHEVGSHTQVHSNAWKVSPWHAISDMREGCASVAGLGGKGTLFRPPYGKLTLGGLAVASRWQLAWWTVDPRDSWAPRPIESVLAEIEEQGGGVVLMHDFDRSRRGPLSSDEHRTYVLELTRRLIELARKKNWPIRTIGEVI